MDTIYASANQNVSSIKIIRISGPEARKITKIFDFKLPKPKKYSVTKLTYKKRLIDKAVVFWLPGPNTITGEDIFELHIHGSIIIEDLVYQALSRQKKFRIANKGEFTKRGFLNGKIDLSQAEAINDIINAETEKQLEIANFQIDGNLRGKINLWRKQILDLSTKIELAIDFSDEEIPLNIEKEFLKNLDYLIKDIKISINNSAFYTSIRSGFLIVIVGKPNVGKSTLMNYIANKDVSIVTEQPGTTRDIIEQKINLNGYPVYFCDTAGVRKTSSLIEKEGIKKTKKMIKNSDIILNLSVDNDFELFSDNYDKKIINVRSKSDINTKPFTNEDISISIKKKKEMEKLLKKISDNISSLEPRESSFLVNKRQVDSAKNALKALKRIKNISIFLETELIAEELRLSSSALSSITNPIDIEEIFDEIFSNFCIGK